MLIYNRFVLLVLLATMLTGCGSSTRITGSWKSPETEQSPPGNVVVMTMTSNVVARRMSEFNMTSALKERGVDAVSSLEIFSPLFLNGQPSRDEILNKLNEEKKEAVMTIALVDEETEQRYTPESSDPYAPSSEFSPFGAYYSTYYPTYYDPGYYTMSKVYYVQTNIYSVKSEKLIWSAQSKTYDPEDLEAATREFAREVVRKLQEDHIFSFR